MTMQHIGPIAGNIVDRWTWWRNALAGKVGPIHDGDPQQGYYRVRPKDGQWEPVAIFYPEGSDQIVAYRAGKEVDADRIWTWACRNPISYEAYDKAINGGGFDDEPPRAPGIGDNSGEADPFDALRIEFEGEAEQAREFLKSEVKTQSDADRAGIWSKRLSDISKRADGQREVEKAPHLAASRAVDDRWRPLVNDPKDLATKLKRHVETFMIAQKRAEEARARAAAEEAARLRREAEEAAAAQRLAPEPDEQAEAERAELIRRAQEAEKAAEVRNATAGRTGARVALRTDKRARIVDFDACLAALKDRPEIVDAVQSLANRAVKSGFSLPGVEVELVEKVA
jgi:hypothetical protein